MNSIKELKEQLGYEEIGLDDTFTGSIPKFV